MGGRDPLIPIHSIIYSFKTIFLTHKFSPRHHSRLWGKWVWQTRSPLTIVSLILNPMCYLYWNSVMTNLTCHFPTYYWFIHQAFVNMYYVSGTYSGTTGMNSPHPQTTIATQQTSKKLGWGSSLILHPQMFMDDGPGPCWWIANNRSQKPGFWNMAKENQWIQDKEYGWRGHPGAPKKGWKIRK